MFCGIKCIELWSQRFKVKEWKIGSTNNFATFLSPQEKGAGKETDKEKNGESEKQN